MRWKCRILPWAVALAMIAGTMGMVEQSEPAAREQLSRFSKSFSNADEWKRRAAANRAGILRGANLTTMPAKCAANAIVHSRREFDGYSVENVAFESFKGFYVTGNIYRPLKTSDSMPAILAPHGHSPAPGVTDKYKTRVDGGRLIDEYQYFCSTLARMGAVVFTYDMVGWGDSQQTNHEDPNLLTLQLVDSIRVLDYVLTIPGVDAKRVAITGVSGGGTQTIMLTAVDDRITVSAPIVMVSAHYFGGCRCESGMPIHNSESHETNNADVAAMAAPRPQLLVSCGGDWTKNTPKVELPYIRSVYQLFGAAANVENVHLPNDVHDIGLSKRQAVYPFLAEHFKLNTEGMIKKDGTFDESRTTLVPQAKLHVFDKEHPQPATALKNLGEIAKALKGNAGN